MLCTRNDVVAFALGFAGEGTAIWNFPIRSARKSAENSPGEPGTDWSVLSIGVAPRRIDREHGRAGLRALGAGLPEHARQVAPDAVILRRVGREAQQRVLPALRRHLPLERLTGPNLLRKRRQHEREDRLE